MTTDAHPLAAPVDLPTRARGLLTTARSATSGRAATNLVPGVDRMLTQTLLALTAGTVLGDHVAPGPATLQVLTGSGVLTVDEVRLPLGAGGWTPVPEAPHGVQATTDLVCLLTVANPRPIVTEPRPHE